jgi:HK97 family phage major capsid protein
VQTSNEAAADGTAIDQQLAEALNKGIGWLLDTAFLTSSGVGQPLGVLNAPATITVATEVDDDLSTALAASHPRVSRCR